MSIQSELAVETFLKPDDPRLVAEGSFETAPLKILAESFMKRYYRSV